MSFWDTTGNITGNPEDAFTRSFQNIPDGSMVLAKIKAFEIIDNQHGQYLEVTWKVVGTEFDGSLIRQKIKCWEMDANKKHRALNMFMLLHKMYGFEAPNREPNRMDLLRFVNKGAGLKVQETKPNEEGKRYNWVSEVHPYQGFTPKIAEFKEDVVKVVTPSQMPNDDLDSDIPF